jgi:chromosomal replication initiation ATPase DnaA
MVHAIEWIKRRKEQLIKEPEETIGTKLDGLNEVLKYLETPKILTLDLIKKTVEDVLEIPDISVKSSKMPLPDARKIFIKIAFENCTRSQFKIMTNINRNRTTFYHSIKEVESLLESDPNFRSMYYSVYNDLML